ncbi:MAG: hypothetical protein BGO54_16760 [Sphingobacteriales bacterium 46-32]|nr:MAG: hypothetical protein BGO54_16760 [Sphingobacteriales bacterium 46-32]
MIKPSDNQIAFINDLIHHSLEKLVAEDSDIFKAKLIEPPVISEGVRLLNRELHETAINHRLAYYFEEYMQGTLT